MCTDVQIELQMAMRPCCANVNDALACRTCASNVTFQSYQIIPLELTKRRAVEGVAATNAMLQCEGVLICIWFHSLSIHLATCNRQADGLPWPYNPKAIHVGSAVFRFSLVDGQMISGCHLFKFRAHFCHFYLASSKICSMHNTRFPQASFDDFYCRFNWNYAVLPPIYSSIWRLWKPSIKAKPG